MNHLAYLLIGLGAGAIFAALAMALVVTYRSSGVVNLGAGTMALFGAYFYANLRTGQVFVPIPGLPPTVDLGSEWGFWPAMVVSVLVSGLLGLLLYALIFRPLRNAPPLSRVVASVGVLVAFPALIGLRLGSYSVIVQPIFPVGTTTVGDTPVPHDRLYLALTVLVLAGLLHAAFRLTRFGLITRAVADSEKGAILSGIAPQRVALANWGLSGAVAGLGGVLISPIVPLSPAGYSLFIVPALAAAVLGRFVLLWPAILGGLVIGMLQSELTYLTFLWDWLPRSGLPDVVPLVLIFVMLWLPARGLPERGAVILQQLAISPRPRHLATTAIVSSVLAVAALFALSGVYRVGLITSFIFTIIALSIVLITGYLGQISLAQLVLAGVAGFTLSALTTSWSVPFPIAPLLAALVAAVVGLVIGLPALRLRGLTFAVVTLALAVAITKLWFQNPSFSNGLNKVAGPELFGWDLRAQSGAGFDRVEFGVLVLLVTIAAAVGVALIRCSRFGGVMLAIRANERSAAASGIDVTTVKVVTFTLSAFIAGIGGALLAYQRQTITADSYEVLAGLGLFTFVYISGITSVSGAVLAGLVAPGGLIYVWLEGIFDVSGYYQLVAAVALVMACVFHPEGIVGVFHHLFDKLRHRRLYGPDLGAPPVALGGDVERLHPKDQLVASVQASPTRSDSAPALIIRGATVAYGGVVAVSQVDVDVMPGTIVGLIGPNGAGKTTLVDAITGFVRGAGITTFCGEDISRAKPHQRVRRGLSRTFQAAELWDDLTVGENIAVGATGGIEDIVTFSGLDELMDISVSELSHGHRRVVSIARALATGPSVVLLDEPAAGLDSLETEALGRHLLAMRDSGVAILLVDHDMNLVMSVCDKLYVLDFGKVIASGSPEEILNDPLVSAAYLGDVNVAEAEVAE